MAKTDAFIPLNFAAQDEQAMVQAARAFYQQMASRRSVRDFSAKPIPQSILEQAILAAGLCAQWCQYAALAFCGGAGSGDQEEDSSGRGDRRAGAV